MDAEEQRTLAKSGWSNIPAIWRKLIVIGIVILFIGFIAIVLFYIVVTDTSPTPMRRTHNSSSILHIYHDRAACSDNIVCSEVAKNILDKGNAIDAVIATGFCLGLTTMQSMGIGGGFVMNYYRKSDTSHHVLDAREVSPIEAKQETYITNPNARNEGAGAIGVPGEVAGYWEAHLKFGQLAWQELIEPSLQICKNGFKMSKHMENSIKLNPRIKNDSHLYKMLYKGAQSQHKAGDKLHPPKELCETYRRIMINGGDDYYNGSLAQDILMDLKDIGSVINANDFKYYRPNWQNTIDIDIGNNSIHLVPAPAGGVLVGFIMNILEGFNFTKNDIKDYKSEARMFHLIAEAYKFAFAQRTLLGDPNYNDIESVTENLTSKAYADAIRKTINLNSVTFDNPTDYGGSFDSPPDDHGTSHISITSKNGDAVSLTSSVNYYFGSGNCGKRTGIVFNSAMDDFSYPGYVDINGWTGSKRNELYPGKRPFSSRSPTIVTDTESKDVKYVVGAAGGTKIITSVAYVLTRLMWLGDDIKMALDRPRLHHQLYPNILFIEEGIDNKINDELHEKYGHTVKSYFFGSVICGLTRNSTAIFGNADFRKGGGVSGL